MTDDEARAKVAEYMGWNVPAAWQPESLPSFSDGPIGWWEFGQLVAAWERDDVFWDGGASEPLGNGHWVRLRRTSLDSFDKWLAFGFADSLLEAAYRATVKMLEGRR